MIELWALTGSANELDAREREQLAREMEDWVEAGNLGVALVTCHRAELYGLGAAPNIAVPRVRAGREAIAHLFRVAAGLESAIVGEDEVLHQVRDALRSALSNRRRDQRLQRLFESAVATGRRARSRRTASSGNLAQSAVAWLRGRSSVSDRPVVVAGAGRMGAALAHSLADAGAVITIASRDQARAARLAHVYQGRGVSLDEGARLIDRAAAVAVALGGPWNELDLHSASELPPIADISAPQAVPDSVRQRLNGGFLGIDDLYRQQGPLPGAYIKDAEELVERYTREFLTWLGGRS